MPAAFDLRSELRQAIQGLTWDLKGILLTSGVVIPIPAESRVVTAILQSLAIALLKDWGKAKNIKVQDFPLETRGYPDVALSDGPLGDHMIALDIKSARFLGDDKVSRMTLGTYDGYFLHPNEKLLHQKKMSYDDYTEHWVVGIVYEWHPEEDAQRLVKIVEFVVGEKWQLASRVSGSGDTANMGAIDSLSKLRSLKSTFRDEDEFEKYWRKYALEHKRKRTRAPR